MELQIVTMETMREGTKRKPVINKNRMKSRYEQIQGIVNSVPDGMVGKLILDRGETIYNIRSYLAMHYDNNSYHTSIDATQKNVVYFWRKISYIH